ncbi:MAG TPA: hypothetical protein VGQ81_16865 [Acidobacteriota bacterium]|nr:hypothetical protein [Acidobacteriota bacterium]
MRNESRIKNEKELKAILHLFCIRNTPSVIRIPQSIHSAIGNPPSKIRNSQSGESAIRNPQSAIGAFRIRWILPLNTIFR